MQFNSTQREISLKVVYYGPPLSGKTSNLQALHRLLDRKISGRLTVLDTADDRTLFFDMLPVVGQTASGHTIKLKVFTVPGQVIHAATRRVVLSGADGVVFVADSQRAQAQVNNEFWHGMRGYLRANTIDPDTIPTVLQFNKQDLPDTRGDDELAEIRQRGREPVFGAVAIRGVGVLETFHGLLKLVFSDLDQRYDFSHRFQFSPEPFFSHLLALRANVPLAPEPGR